MASAYHLMKQAKAEATTAGNEELIDLRSDTVTRPSPEMMEWMMQAPVGDDVYGEDISVNLLENTAAQILGKEAGLFVSSGTQSNLIALLSHCGRGDEYLVGDKYHIYMDEAGGPSVLGSMVCCPLVTDSNGALSANQITQSVKDDDPHYAITKLLCLENTVWGRVQSVASMTQLTNTARAAGLLCHLDGARIMNAAVGSKADPKEITQGFDSVSMCLSKGLGAPVGSVLCGSKAFIRRARRVRKLVGGGMRQAGVLAACGLYALEHNIVRLADDHAKAQRLVSGLQEIEQLRVEQHTNMVFVEPEERDRSSLMAHLQDHQILIGAPLPIARLVTHLDTSEADIDKVVDVLREFYHR